MKLKSVLLCMMCATTAPILMAEEAKSEVLQRALQLGSPEHGIGARIAGSEEEQRAAKWVIQQFSDMGLKPEVHEFKHPVLKSKDEFINSQNIIVDLKGNSDKMLVIGAHYDSTGDKKGSQGAMDNASGTSVMLTVASQLAKMDNLPFSIRFIAFGAEEIGKVGSRYYMRELAQDSTDIERMVGMINLDTVAGGDFLYVHSSHTTPYKCNGDNSSYTYSTAMREAVLKASKATLGDDAHKIHPEFPGYPEGVTGDWSDHEAFACHGVPIAYIETTNFSINGRNGYDGYSQSVDPALWDCFDPESMTACDREKETLWGHIWHEKHDRFDYLMKTKAESIEKQLNNNVSVLVEFFANADKYLN